MSTFENLKSCRVISAESVGAQFRAVHRTVNIINSLTGYVANMVKPRLQLTAAQVAAASDPHAFETVIAAGAVNNITPGLPTYYISGYAGPN